MGWASHYIDKLKQGETVQFRPHGGSMSGKISSGQLCTVIPIGSSELKKGDIVLCKVGGREYLHLISSIKGDKYEISNNKGYVNGLVQISNIYGLCVLIED